MEPIVTIILNADYTTLGDWTQEEVNWLLKYMDWSVTRVGDYVSVSFYIPVTSNN